MKQLTRILLGFSFLLLSGLFSIAFADITIDDNATLRSLNNNPTKLHNYLNKYQHVHLKTRDGAWVGRIILPNHVNKGKKVTLSVNSFFGVVVVSGSTSYSLNKGDTVSWVYTNGSWIHKNGSWTYENGSWVAQNWNNNYRLITDNDTLRSLQNNAAELKKYINTYKEVHLQTRNDTWIQNINLPDSVNMGKKVTLTVNSTWGVKVNYNGITTQLNEGDKQQWVYANNTWNKVFFELSFNNLQSTINWNPDPRFQQYEVFYANEPISLLSDTSNISSLKGGGSTIVQDNKFDISHFDTETYYFLIKANIRYQYYAQSNEKKIVIYVNKSNGINEEVISQPIKPNLLQPVGHSLIAEVALKRALLSGYDLSDIKAYAINQNNAYNLRVENKTPRKFAKINVVIDGKGYVINEELSQFSHKDISLTGVNLKPDSKVSFLQPNLAYQPNVSSFGTNNTDKTVSSYFILQSHLKDFYSKKSTRDDFYNYFLKTRSETKQSLIDKWTRITSTNIPKEHKVFASDAIGSASVSWLNLNWVMTNFIANKSYTLIYAAYSHEYAHTIGFEHGSGLAYGWDDFVATYMKNSFKSNSLTAGEIVSERADIFWHLDVKGNKLVAYSQEPDRFSLSNIRLFLPNYVDKIYIVDDAISLRSMYSVNPRILVNADVLDNGNSNNHLANYIVNQVVSKDSADMDIFVGIISKNYSGAANNNSGVYFTVPDQDNVVSHNAGATTGWYSEIESTIVVKVRNIETNNEYTIPLIGEQGKYAMTAGVPAGNGQVKFSIDSKKLNLPKGIYKGEFTIEARGWHDPSYTKELKVVVRYIVK